MLDPQRRTPPEADDAPWRMSLSGSELARITREGDDLVLAFAVAQVRPVQAPRFGQGDDTAYLAGVVLRLEAVGWGAAGAAEGGGVAPDGLLGRLTECEVRAMGQRCLVLALPGDVAGPLTLTLRSALGAEWTLQARRLSLQLRTDPGAGASPWPSLAC